jgi:hypothetical protein
MLNHIRFGAFLLGGLLWTAALAHAQNAAYLARLQAESNFSTWPGQNGTVQGFNFQPSQYGALSGFSISSDTSEIDYLTTGVIRLVTLTNGTGSLTLTIGVGVSSVTNGHTLFLISDAVNRDLDYFTAFVRGDQLTTNTVTVGDLNFVQVGSDSTNFMGYLGFLRNNVFVTMQDGQTAPTGVNLGVLASEIDGTIQNQATLPLTYAAPVINTFSPVTTSLSQSTAPSTTATVTITDPTGTGGPISRQFQTGGNLTVVDTGGPSVTITATATTGTLPLTLVALNAYLQFSSSTVTFNVTP